LQGSIASEEHEPMRILWDLFTVGKQLEGVFVKIVALILFLKKNIYIYILKIYFFIFKKNFNIIILNQFKNIKNNYNLKKKIIST
jgi:hypothetical protein